MNNQLELLINGFTVIPARRANIGMKKLEMHVNDLIKTTSPTNDSGTAYFWGDEGAQILNFLEDVLNKNFGEYFNNTPLFQRAWIRRSFSGYGGSGWHQDTNLNVIPQPIILAIAMQDVKSNNSPLIFLPRSQHSKHPQFNCNYIGGQKTIFCNKGDIVVFMSSIWHRGGANTSQEDRLLVFAEYSNQNFVKTSLDIKKYQKDYVKLIT